MKPQENKHGRFLVSFEKINKCNEILFDTRTAFDVSTRVPRARARARAPMRDAMSFVL